jgi:predicted ATPase/class 3 adenylate cyclase
VVTFLFTDVEGSTRLLERHPSDYGAGIARHHDLLAAAVGRRGGVVFETIGDAVYAAFPNPAGAVAAAADAQISLAEEDWGSLGEVAVRMGLHTGPVERRGSHYFGPALYRCARLMATAHGGQVVLSEATAKAVAGDPSVDASLLDLGQHVLKDMLEPERVYQLVRPPLRSEFPPLRSAGGRPNNLPSDVKTFVGRQEELRRVHELLTSDDVRLVTLTGPGGSGKTRLALRAAEPLLEPFRDGVFLVGLTPLADPSFVAPAIAEVLGVQKTAGRAWVDSLVTHLGSKELLLVLDNFEHVVPAAPDLAAILAATPNVRILATSRVPLRLQGEHELLVGPLPLPEPGSELDALLASPSVQLFVERAREIRADMTVVEGNGEAVGEICRRLDGLPLAIELAAGRTRLLSPEAMLERLGDRLRLLTGGAADLPSRQRTLRDAIGWSYNLLDRPERDLLARLAVFRGGCTLEAAESVCGGDLLAPLTVLTEHNLVVTRWNELGDPRFEMLETIAEFARERLAESGQADELGRRHAAFFADYSELIEPFLYTDARVPWLTRLAEDRDNIRAALAWSAEHDEAAYGLRILGALWLWWWTAFAEGVEWADRLLPLPSAAEPDLVRARALFTGEICAAGTGDLEHQRGYTEQAVELSRAIGGDEVLALAQSLGAGLFAGMTAIDEFEDLRGPELLRAVSEDAIRIGERSGNPWVAAWAKMISGLIALLSGNVETARPWAAEAVVEFTELGDSWSRGTASMTHAFALVQLGELEAAEAALEGCVPALLEVGDLKIASSCLIAYGLIARFSGRADDSERHYAEALELCVRAGDPNNAPFCLEGIAAAVVGRDPERAARLLGAARELYDAGHFPTVPGFEPFHEASSALVGELLGADRAGELRTRGAAAARAIPLAEVVHV